MIVVACALFVAAAVRAQEGKVELVSVPGEKKVDVMFDGALFTSYIYPDDLSKPVLYPVLTAWGTPITRGYPRDPAPGERVDHPQHVGMWFNFGNVNGLDFWNSSPDTAEDKKQNYGTIHHREIKSMESGIGKAAMTVLSDWNAPDGKTLLKAETKYVFGGEGYLRTIEHTVTLTAQDVPVVFTDSKEGLFGIRMDRVFEEPSDEPVIRVGTDGKIMENPSVDNQGVNGLYRNSLGQEREAGTWGRPAEWMHLAAHKEGEDISVVIIDHPGNPGYPAHWHSRGYGLFAANNMGSRRFHEENPEFTLTLSPGESVTFLHKVLINSSSFLTDEEINKLR